MKGKRGVKKREKRRESLLAVVKSNFFYVCELRTLFLGDSFIGNCKSNFASSNQTDPEPNNGLAGRKGDDIFFFFGSFLRQN